MESSTIELIHKTVAVGATPDQLRMLIYLAEEYDLDPLKKEIFFVRGTVMTSRDGYLKHANNHVQFNGIESDTVYEGDTLTRRDDGSIHILYGEPHMNFSREKLRGAYSNVFRKDRDKASAVFVDINDYLKDTQVWKTYTNAMILKVAEAMALKRAFAMSGLVTQEEIGEKE